MINLLASFIPWEWIAGAVAALVAFAAVYLSGGKSARQRAKIDAQSGYVKTRKKIDEADYSSDDIGVLRERMRERDPKQR